MPSEPTLDEAAALIRRETTLENAGNAYERAALTLADWHVARAAREAEMDRPLDEDYCRAAGMRDSRRWGKTLEAANETWAILTWVVREDGVVAQLGMYSDGSEWDVDNPTRRHLHQAAGLLGIELNEVP